MEILNSALTTQKLFLSVWTSTGIVAASVFATSGDFLWQLFCLYEHSKIYFLEREGERKIVLYVDWPNMKKDVDAEKCTDMTEKKY
jgi:hypothetical protein